MIYVSVNFFVFWGERVLMRLTNITTIVSVECVQLTVLLENILGVMEYILQLQQFFLDDGPSKSDWIHYFF